MSDLDVTRIARLRDVRFWASFAMARKVSSWPRPAISRRVWCGAPVQPSRFTERANPVELRHNFWGPFRVFSAHRLRHHGAVC